MSKARDGVEDLKTIDANLAAKASNTALAAKAPLSTPSFTGNTTVTAGNLVIGTSGKGIDFSIVADSSATGASTNSEILDCYEEGTWTPAIMLTTGNVTLSEAFNYTKVGRLVTLRGYIYNGSSIANTNAIWQFGGLPFQPLRETYGAVAQYATTVPGDSEYCNIYVNPTHSYLRIYSTRTGTNDWLQWSNIGGGHIDFHITYMATS